MVPIYIKLGTASEYHDERLNFHLTASKPAAILDYTNVNDNIQNGLIAGEIVQISEAEFYNLTPPDPEDPLVVVPSELINITQFLNPCPLDATTFFAYYGGKWYKVLWSTIKACAGSGSGSLHFRVGNPSNDLDFLPDIGENKFINSVFSGKTAENISVFINGSIVHPRSMYEEVGDDADYDWYTLHEDVTPGDTPNMFKRNPSFAFSDKDLVIIKGL